MADIDPNAAAAAAATGDAGTGPAPTTGTPTAGAGAGNATLTLTQADIDAMIERRTAQARRVASENAEKARLYDESLAAQQTESEKAQAKIKAAEDAANARLAAANARLIAADIRVKAAAAGVRPEALDLVVEHLLKLDGIAVSDTGEVTGIDAELAEFVKSHDYLLVPKAPAAPARGGAPTGMAGGAGEPPVGEKIADALKRRDVRSAIGLKLQPKA